MRINNTHDMYVKILELNSMINDEMFDDLGDPLDERDFPMDWSTMRDIFVIQASINSMRKLDIPVNKIIFSVTEMATLAKIPGFTPDITLV